MAQLQFRRAHAEKKAHRRTDAAHSRKKEGASANRCARRGVPLVGLGTYWAETPEFFLAMLVEAPR